MSVRTLSGTPAAPTQPGGRRSRWYGWPLTLMFVAFPVWWILGISAFIWPILAVPMGLSLLRRRKVRVPRGFGVWLMFLLWMLGSATQLNDPLRGVPFAFRAVDYAAATIIFLYVFNAPSDLLTDRRVVLSIAVFWMITAAGGFLGALAPHFEFRSIMEGILPQRLASNEFVHQLIHPASAQISTFLGYENPRPKAPFEYTNDWGAVFALTTPFLILGWSYARTTLWRWSTGLFLVAAVVPVIVSLDRGLWLSLGLGMIYAGFRLAAKGRVRPLAGLLTGMVLVAALLVFTPLRGTIVARFEHQHSNTSRETVYLEAAKGVLASPLLGFGAPRPSQVNDNQPSIGTQGQFWLVLYSHGIIGLLFYLGWYVVCFWQTRRGRSRLTFWCNVVLFISIIQLPFYGQLPAQIQVTMVAAALGLREVYLGSSSARDPEPSLRTASAGTNA